MVRNDSIDETDINDGIRIAKILRIDIEKLELMALLDLKSFVE